MVSPMKPEASSCLIIIIIIITIIQLSKTFTDTQAISSKTLPLKDDKQCIPHVLYRSLFSPVLP